MQIFQNSENPANAYFEITRTHFLLFVIAVPVMAWQSPGVVFNLSVYVKSRLKLMANGSGCTKLEKYETHGADGADGASAQGSECRGNSGRMNKNNNTGSLIRTAAGRGRLPLQHDSLGTKDVTRYGVARFSDLSQSSNLFILTEHFQKQKFSYPSPN